MKPWRTLDSATVLENRWLTVRRDTVETNTGVILDDFYTVSQSDAVIIVPVDRAGRVILKEEYRYSVRESMIEVPAGMIDPSDPDPLSAARRELAEETGYASDQWSLLGCAVPEPSKLTGRFRIYLARDCDKVSEPSPDPAESITVSALPLAEALAMVLSGSITGSVTAHALLLAANALDIPIRP